MSNKQRKLITLGIILVYLFICHRLYIWEINLYIKTIIKTSLTFLCLYLYFRNIRNVYDK